MKGAPVKSGGPDTPCGCHSSIHGEPDIHKGLYHSNREKHALVAEKRSRGYRCRCISHCSLYLNGIAQPYWPARYLRNSQIYVVQGQIYVKNYKLVIVRNIWQKLSSVVREMMLIVTIF